MASPGSDEGVVSAAAAAAVVVCCMCGDHGLPHELFPCSLCHHRTQHRYCSDLYPRVSGPYRSCNWCLRQGGAGAGGGGSRSPVKAPAPASAWTKRRISDSRGEDDRDNDESSCCGYGCSRSVFSADPGKPIKKPKKKGRERAVPQRPEPVVTTVSKKTREMQAGKPRFKVKVRRYKLLAEVIC